VHASRLEHELNALAATRMFIERVRLAPLCFSAQYQAYISPISPYISLYLPISPSASRRSTRRRCAANPKPKPKPNPKPNPKPIPKPIPNSYPTPNGVPGGDVVRREGDQGARRHQRARLPRVQARPLPSPLALPLTLPLPLTRIPHPTPAPYPNSTCTGWLACPRCSARSTSRR